MWYPCRRPVFSPVCVHVVNTPALGTMFQFVRRTPSKSRDCARARNATEQQRRNPPHTHTKRYRWQRIGPHQATHVDFYEGTSALCQLWSRICLTSKQSAKSNAFTRAWDLALGRRPQQAVKLVRTSSPTQLRSNRVLLLAITPASKGMNRYGILNHVIQPFSSHVLLHFWWAAPGSAR